MGAAWRVLVASEESVLEGIPKLETHKRVRWWMSFDEKLKSEGRNSEHGIVSNRKSP